MSSIEIGSLEKAILQLESGIKEAQQNLKSEIIRDGVIQRFEYTMDLAWKLMQRYKVDIIDWQSISDDFKKIIERDKVALNP